MIKFYFTTIVALFFVFSVTGQKNYVGNGNSGFGGPLGQSSLQLTDDGTTVTGTFTKGTSGNLGNELVIYIDSKTGGFNSTANFNDPNTGDKLRRSIAGTGGFDDASRSVVNFPSGFEADYAIAINTDFGGLWELVESAEFPFVTAVGNPANETDASFTFSFDWTDLGISNTDEFKFVITYMDGFGGNGVFRSDEGYGNGLQSGNPGTNDVSFTTYFDYPQGRMLGVVNTAASGNWSANSTWGDGNKTGSDVQININHDVIVDVAVTVNNTLTVNNTSSLKILPTKQLNLNGTLINNGTTIFESNASGTAQLINTSTATVTGDITVERFIPAQTNNRRAFRFVTSSVNSTESIYKNWQDNGGNTAGIGTHITGSSTGANGFDATASGAPSLFTFDNTDTSAGQQNGWNAIENTAVRKLKAGEAYRLFIRGDRNYDLTSSPAAAPNSDVTLIATGSPVTNNTTVTGLNPVAGNFSMVGNPFQAVVDYRLLTKSNVNPNFIYVWNANAGAENGAYETININTTDTQEQELLYVQPGQSFFVATATNGAASISFDLDDQAPTFSNLTTLSTNDSPYIKTILNAVDGTDKVAVDKLHIVFDGSDDITVQDAYKLFNPGENLSRKIGDNYLAYESRSTPQDGDQIELNILNYKERNYQLDLFVTLASLETTAVLLDRYLDTQTVLNEGLNSIPFFINENSSSSAPDRFSIEFSKSTASVTNTVTNPIAVYPNPARGSSIEINMGDLDNQPVSLTLVNLLGQQVLAQSLETSSNNPIKLDVSNVPSGMYLLRVSNDQINASRKIVIE